MKLSLVVPCYNEEKNVEDFFSCCQNAFKEKIKDYEIIFINDGSADDTWSKLKLLASDNKSVKCINFSRNFGKEAAMYAGLQHAKGDYVSIVDADLQQRPEIVLEMVEFLDNNADYDCVAAYQEKRIENKLLGFVKNMFYKIINKVSDTTFMSGVSDFRTFRQGVVESILQVKEYYRFSKGIFSWVGYNVHYIPYVAEERAAGTTSWSVKKLFKYAIEGIIAFTTFPLKLSSIVGVITAIAAFLYMIAVIIEKLFFGIDSSGYATITTLILFLGGIQLIALGILGEYVSKIYIQGKNRPIYIVKEKLNTDKKED